MDNHPRTNLSTEAVQKFGTFGGVFTPSILTIFGVIMFMRANYVVGEAGVIGALLILALSKVITLATGFSISAIATNTEVRAGGAYFLISRTLGPEFGGAIGLALLLAQTLSVPFYVLGFSEAVVKTLPFLSGFFPVVNLVTLAAVFWVAYVGAGWAIKAQYVIMGILFLSIATFLIGAATHFDSQTLQANLGAGFTDPKANFWTVFAIYFPAVTGIMAGVNMSGNLKDPGKSLPLGTFAAILLGAAVYALQILLYGGAVPRAGLSADPYQSLLTNALFGLGFLVAMGVFCATLSSALGSILGAPRILQAIGQDKLLSPLNFFGRLSRKGEPVRALWLVFVVSAVVLLYAGGSKSGGAFNAIAAVVTMLFLFTYGMVNLAAFVESFGRNPSFRPRFRWFHWSIALVGAVGCGVAAVLIDPLATIGAAILVVLIFAYVRKFVLSTSFGDARRGFYYSRIRDNLFKLSHLPMHPKNWRPTILVLSSNPKTRLLLARHALSLGSGRGIVTLVSILIGEYVANADQRRMHLKEMQDMIDEHGLQAFPEVLVTPDFEEGLTQLFQTTSLPPLKPNLVLMGWCTTESRADSYVRSLRVAQSLGMSIILLVNGTLPGAIRKGKRIDVWWRGQENGSLMIILAYLVSLSPGWSGTTIRIIRVVRTQEEKNQATEQMKGMIEAARMNANIHVLIADSPFIDLLHHHSSDAELVFLGFRAPDEQDARAFQARFSKLLDGMPSTLLVYSSGEADLMT